MPPSRVEIHAKTYLLSMCQIALQVLAKGGTFVCRVADIHTRFSAGLLFLLYRSFKQVRKYLWDPYRMGCMTSPLHIKL